MFFCAKRYRMISGRIISSPQVFLIADSYEAAPAKLVASDLGTLTIEGISVGPVEVKNRFV